jgi:hypothetical protein
MVKVLTMIIVPLLMVATVSTIPVEAKVWYVRPFGGHYGTADGLKYENAFNGFNNLNWGKEGIQSEDTLYVCGTHRQTLYIRKSRITVRLDYPSDKGVIYGSSNISGDDSSWRGPNSKGEHYTIFPEQCRIVARNGSILTPGEKGGLKDDEWFWENGWLYLGSKPDGYNFEIGLRSHAITWDENSPVKDTTIVGDGNSGSKIFFTNEYAIGPKDQYPDKFADKTYYYPNKINFGTLTVKGLYFFGVQAVQTYFWYEMDANIIDGCEIYESPAEGLYLAAGKASVTVKNCIIGSGKFNKFGWGSQGTAHAGDGIDIKGGEPYKVRSAVVTNNEITNVRGCGIISGCGDIRIEGNRIRDCGWNGVHFGKMNQVDFAGIVVGGGENKYSKDDKIIVKSNRIVQRDYPETGIMVRGAQQSPVLAEVSDNMVLIEATETEACYIQPAVNQRFRNIQNNYFIGGKYGIKTVYGNPVDMIIKNNTVVNNAYPLVIARKGQRGSGVAIQNNVFYPFQTGKTRYPYQIGTSSYSTVEEMDRQEEDCRGNREQYVVTPIQTIDVLN